MSERTRRWSPGRPVALVATLGVVRRGAGDPTWRADGPDGLWKAWRTPDGPVTAHLQVDAEGVTARAWGPGAAWLLDGLPGLLGDGDDDSGFQPAHRAVRDARRRFAGWRVPRTRLVLESLVPSVIEQKVTGAEAFASYRRLVRGYGEPAPGPGAQLGLLVAPDAATWAQVPSWEWLRAGVEPARSRVIVQVVRRAARLEALTDEPAERARETLQVLPGVGVWTAAEVAHTAFGDADAVSFGDYHVARNIGWVLRGEDMDDEGLALLLAPYAGHRYRVQRLLELVGAGRPRRGPRRALPRHIPGP